MKVNHNTKTITATEFELHMVANYLEHCTNKTDKWKLIIEDGRQCKQRKKG